MITKVTPLKWIHSTGYCQSRVTPPLIHSTGSKGVALARLRGVVDCCCCLLLYMHCMLVMSDIAAPSCSVISDTQVMRIHFGDDDPAWTQATLPVRYGGLGFRSAVQLAPSAYLASAAASSGLISHILPASLQPLPIPHLDAAVALWSQGHDNLPPSGSAACNQKTWDASVVSTSAEGLLEDAPDDMARARLLAVSAKESGAWLHAFPISILGLRMDDNTVRIAMGLRLGSTLCRPHVCQHCGAEWTTWLLMDSAARTAKGATTAMGPSMTLFTEPSLPFKAGAIRPSPH